MKRSVLASVAAVAGVAGVVGLHSPANGVAMAVSRSAAGSSTSGAGGAAAAGTGGSAAKAAPPPSSVPAGVHSATGKSEQYGYGVLAVTAHVDGRRITDVTVASLQTAESYSQQLAVQVIPMLRSQVLAAQGSRINGITGATYTSEAYALSLQSALDKLHVP